MTSKAIRNGARSGPCCSAAAVADVDDDGWVADAAAGDGDCVLDGPPPVNSNDADVAAAAAGAGVVAVDAGADTVCVVADAKERFVALA